MPKRQPCSPAVECFDHEVSGLVWERFTSLKAIPHQLNEFTLEVML